MPAPVLLPDIVEALEIQFDESYSFLDLEMGQVETISAELLRKAEESEEDDDADVLDWQKREWEIAKRIISTDRFRKLATKFDVLEWAIMEDFARSVTSDRIRNDLLNAIHGAGAFRHFKETLRRHRIEPAWFTFRDDALRLRSSGARSIGFSMLSRSDSSQLGSDLRPEDRGKIDGG